MNKEKKNIITRREASVFAMMLEWRMKEMRDFLNNGEFVEKIGGFDGPIAEGFKMDLREYSHMREKMEKIAEGV